LVGGGFVGPIFIGTVGGSSNLLFAETDWILPQKRAITEIPTRIILKVWASVFIYDSFCEFFRFSLLSEKCLKSESKFYEKTLRFLSE
jgi:hypothetical protein